MSSGQAVFGGGETRATTTNESAGGKKTLLHLGFLDQSCGIGIGFVNFYFFWGFGS